MESCQVSKKCQSVEEILSESKLHSEKFNREFKIFTLGFFGAFLGMLFVIGMFYFRIKYIW